MFRKFIVYPVAIFLLCSAQVFSACAGHSCTNFYIERLIVSANGEVTIGTSGDEGSLSCSAGTYGYIKLLKSSDNYDAVYSLLLAAHVAKTEMWIRTNDTGDCNIVYIVSDH
jgi:hypothetical protein